MPLDEVELLIKPLLHALGDAAVAPRRGLEAQPLQVAVRRVARGHVRFRQLVVDAVGQVEVALLSDAARRVDDSRVLPLEEPRHRIM